MNTGIKHFIRITGIVAVILGILDPMEGSVIIAAGSILITWHAYSENQTGKKEYLLSTFMILFGVFFLFFLSSLGGIGGDSQYSIWWGLLIMPYPAGWLLMIFFLIRNWNNARKNKNINTQN